MGKKGKLYFIVFINLLAWGYVGYKIYSALQGGDDVDLGHDVTTIKKINETVKEEKTFLALNYDDPFLKAGNFSNTSNNNVKNYGSTSASFKPKPASAVNKPIAAIVEVKPTLDIKYLGLLKNNDKCTQTAMLSINGRSVFVKQNDVIEGFTVQEISGNDIKIRKGKEVMTIGK